MNTGNEDFDQELTEVAGEFVGWISITKHLCTWGNAVVTFVLVAGLLSASLSHLTVF